MSNVNILRLIPRDDNFLDRKRGVRGEIFFDSSTSTLRVFDGSTLGGISLVKNDLTNVSNATFLAKANAAGVAGADTKSFSTISVQGQSNVVAELSADTLTLESGSGISITTNPTTDTITISNSYSYTLPTATTSVLGGVKVDGTTITIDGNGVISAANQSTSASYSFTIAGDDSTQHEVASGNLVKFVGSGSVTTSASADGVVTITGASASTSFSSLTDAATATLTVDMIYMPAITMLSVTRSGTTAYLFDQYSGNNPNLYVLSGTTLAFNLNVSGFPFLIQDGTGTNYNTGLTHVSTSGVVSTGTNAQGKTSGTLYWKVPYGISGNYRYQAQGYIAMVGAITVRDFALV